MTCVTQPRETFGYFPADDVGLLDLEAVVADAAEAVVEGLDLHPALVAGPPAAQAEPDVGSLVGGTRPLVRAEIDETNVKRKQNKTELDEEKKCCCWFMLLIVSD